MRETSKLRFNVIKQVCREISLPWNALGKKQIYFWYNAKQIGFAAL